MPQIITGSPKDAIDEMIERVKSIERLVASRPQSLAKKDVLDALLDADGALARARRAAARMDNSRLTI